MPLHETMRKAIDELRADRARIDEALAALERFVGGTELEPVPATPATKKPHRSPQAARAAKKPSPAPGAPMRVNWGAMPNFEKWRRELMADVLALPPGRERGAAIELLHQKSIPFAGANRRVGKTTLYAWLKDLEETKPAKRAAPKPQIDDDDEAPADDPHTERGRLQAAGAIGNPVELGRNYDDPSRRKPSCSAYNGCLSYAVKRKWEAFACNACTGPGPQKQRGSRPSRRGA